MAEQIEIGLEALSQKGGNDIFDARIETDINSDDVATPSFTEMADRFSQYDNRILR